jgi:hypothetical protein
MFRHRLLNLRIPSVTRDSAAQYPYELPLPGPESDVGNVARLGNSVDDYRETGAEEREVNGG